MIKVFKRWNKQKNCIYEIIEFQIILESEMDKAKDHQSMTGAEFQKDKNPSRPSSVMSNNSSKTHDVSIQTTIC